MSNEVPVNKFICVANSFTLEKLSSTYCQKTKLTLISEFDYNSSMSEQSVMFEYNYEISIIDVLVWFE